MSQATPSTPSAAVPSNALGAMALEAIDAAFSGNVVGIAPAAAPANEAAAAAAAAAAAPAAPAPADPVPPSAPAAPAASVAAAPAPQPAAPGFGGRTPGSLRARLSGDGEPAAAPAPADSAAAASDKPPASDYPERPPLAPGQKEPTPQAGHEWAKLRTENKTLRGDLQAREREAAEAAAARKAESEARAVVESERDRLKRENDDLLERLGKASLSESPSFQARYDAKIEDATRGLAEEIQKNLGGDLAEARVEAEQLLRLDPARAAQLLADKPPLLAAEVISSIKTVAALQQQRTNELANWRASAAARGAEEARAAVLQSSENRNRWAEKALSTAAKSGHPVFASTDAAVADQVAEIRKEVMGFAQTATEEELVRAAVEGAANPYLYDIINQQQERIAFLESRVEGQFRIGAPPMHAVAAPAVRPAPPPAPAAGVVPVPASSTTHGMADDIVSQILGGRG